MDSQNRELLDAGLATLGLNLAPTQMQALVTAHDRLLATTKAGLNLTGIRDERESVIRNVLDSLAPWKHIAGTLDAAAALKMADVGAGGGMPGFPLAIALPFLASYLIESKAKKATFLSETADAVRALYPECRVVVFDKDANAVALRFDRVVFRAFGPMERIMRVFDRIVAPHGKGIAYKGRRDRIEEELQALTDAQRDRCRVVPVTVPFLPDDEQRHVVLIAAPSHVLASTPVAPRRSRRAGNPNEGEPKSTTTAKSKADSPRSKSKPKSKSAAPQRGHRPKRPGKSSGPAAGAAE